MLPLRVTTSCQLTPPSSSSPPSLPLPAPQWELIGCSTCAGVKGRSRGCVSTLPPGRETFEVQVSVWGLVALHPRQREEGLGGGGL